MKQNIVVPRMGESISEATIGTILKPSGSAVKLDEEVIELETDKVNQVLYAPSTGVVTFSVKPGDVVKIGQNIGFVETEGKPEAIQEAKPEAIQEVKPEVKPQAKSPKAKEEKASSPKQEAVQSIRKGKEEFAEEIKGTKKEKGEAPYETRQKLPKIRKVIAEKLVEAQHTAAMLTTFNEVDLTQVIQLRERYKEKFLKEYKVKLGYMPFFVKASLSALQAFPEVNAYLEGNDLVFRHYYNMGIAVSTDRGLVVPVLRDCEKLSFAEIEKGVEEFIVKAREGTLKVEELQGAGFTITNGGVFGSLLSTPILNPPQIAILGMHKIEQRPVAMDNQVVIRPMMYLALTYDHRVIDGKEAVSFLVHIKQCLEDPARLLLDI